ncbi:hypothetical protein BV20DRAFT_575995 [Pilatotrama ljubarskyi]|nr:hypothetical protein BV20DRAFT_575995 [Pilatotrama ljubarskyi]
MNILQRRARTRPLLHSVFFANFVLLHARLAESAAPISLQNILLRRCPSFCENVRISSCSWLFRNSSLACFTTASPSDPVRSSIEGLLVWECVRGVKEDLRSLYAYRRSLSQPLAEYDPRGHDAHIVRPACRLL